MRRVLCIAAISALFLGILSFVLRIPVEAVADHVYPIAEVPARRVVIVPGAAVRPDGRPSDILAARLDCAATLLRDRRASLVLVSGDHGQASYDETNAMRRYLLALGVRDAAIFLDHAGFRTRDTMERAARVFGVEAAIICTQALHAPRSVYLARDAGIDAVAAVAAGDGWLGAWAHIREHIAIDAAVLDAAIGTPASVLGPRIPIDGDSRISHDGASDDSAPRGP